MLTKSNLIISLIASGILFASSVSLIGSTIQVLENVGWIFSIGSTCYAGFTIYQWFYERKERQLHMNNRRTD